MIAHQIKFILYYSSILFIHLIYCNMTRYLFQLCTGMLILLDVLIQRKNISWDLMERKYSIQTSLEKKE